MDGKPFPVGSRVLASLSGTGYPRSGVVSGVLHRSWVNELAPGDFAYMITFDGTEGMSGPCVAYRAEGEREAVEATSGMGA